MLRLPREAQTSHRARAARCRSWHRLLVYGATTYCLLARSTIVHLWRAARILFSHIKRLCGVRCGATRTRYDLALSRKRVLRTLYSNISRRLSTHAADRSPRVPLFKCAFYSRVSHSLSTRATAPQSITSHYL